MYALHREPEAKWRAWTFTLGAAVTATCCAAVYLWMPAAPAMARQLPIPTKVRVVHSSQPQAMPLERARAPEPIPEVEPSRTPARSPKPVAAKAQAASSNRAPMPELQPARVSEPSPTPLVLGMTLTSPEASSGPSRSATDIAASGPRSPGDARSAGAARDDGSSPLTARRSVTQTSAALLRRLTPVYPKAAQHAGVEGEVILVIVIDAQGRVETASVLKGLGHGLDESAVEAARRTEWRPATANGQPIRSTQRFSVQFKLHS